jgi:hypothetical protein
MMAPGEQTNQTDSPSTRGLRWFSIVVIGPLLLLLILAFPLARSEKFPSQTQWVFLTSLDYAFSLDGVNADVVVFGDSTGLTGVQPLVIEAMTGLRTYNISQSGTFVVVDTLRLDSYLSHNRWPRYILIHVRPVDLRRHDWGAAGTMEGMLTLVRHKADPHTLWLFLTNPVQTAMFATRVPSIWRPFGSAAKSEHARREVVESHGYLKMPPDALEGCENPFPKIVPDTKWISEMRRRYSREGTTVIIYASPFPECETTFDWYASAARTFADNSLARLPVAMFSTDSVHFTPTGARQNSVLVADIIRAAEFARTQGTGSAAR